MAQKPARAPRRYKMKIEQDVYVAMRDGVRIAVCVYRPDAEGQFPALFAASPYQYRYDSAPAYPIFPTRETGPVEFYVQRGYAYVHADVRGSGQSEGEFRWYDEKETRDYYELIEWVGQQDWCTGKVGGIGQSYYAVAQWWMGIVNPPHLACIAPYDGRVDHYRGAGYHGGIFGAFQSNWYNGVRFSNHHRPAHAPTGRKMTYDLGFHVLDHPTYDDWWKERTPYERLKDIKVPVYSIGHWGKLGLHLRGNIVGYEEVTSPKKLLVTGARNSYEAHHMFDDPEFHEAELLPFYDYCLKGIKNGFMDRPPVRLFVRNTGQYRESRVWPIRNTRYESWYLRRGPSKSVTSLNDGGLSEAKPARNEGSTSYRYPDASWRNGVVAFGPDGADPVRGVLTFTSAPLEDDIEVTGSVVLELFASTDQTDADFIVKLADQFPQSDEDRKAGRQPGSVNVSKGWLKASHARTRDEKRSLPWRPFYRHDDPQPIEPGKVARYEIEILPCSYLFQKGHRIRLEIVNGDSAMTDASWTHPYHLSKVGEDTVHHNALRPSRVILPVVPKLRAKQG